MIEITPMVQEDVDAVAQLERRSHLEPWSEEAFRCELVKDCAFACVARERAEEGIAPAEPPTSDRGAGNESGRLEKRIVGYICFWVLLDEVHILNVTVEESHRGRGIGRALLLHALNLGWRLGGRTALLEVRSGNAAARALYRLVGFTRVGERPNYYGVVKEAAIVMELRMDDAWRRTWLD